MSEKEKNELTNEELEQVSGGSGMKMAGFSVGDGVRLIGKYYNNSYGGEQEYTYACGWENLTIGRMFDDGRAAPYRIDHNGTPIGWAPRSSLAKKPH